MSLTLINAALMNLDPPEVLCGGLRIADGRIADLGPTASPQPGDEVIDCHGGVVMPGLVNGHTHLYSALAVGMPPPPRNPTNFHEVLELIWWRLDRAHDAASVEASGLIGALDALRCGTTTLIDHHASPNHIAGSLDDLARGIDAVGLRSVLCYEVTDRNGEAGAFAGLEENRRYIEKCSLTPDGMHAALLGAHAAFTLSDASLSACVELAGEYRTGVHIHVAEDPCDERICRSDYGAPLLDRLTRCGILDNRGDIIGKSILAHGTHLSAQDATRLSSLVAGMAHNPRSNMNNQVGYAPVSHMSRVQLGTDGIGSDMFAEARHAWFKSRDAKTGISPSRIVEMLAHSARVAGRLLGRTLGRLEKGADADVVITDYVPATPIAGDTVAGHLLFAMGAQHVRDVIIAGAWALRNRAPIMGNEQDARRHAVGVTQGLWRRMASL